MPMTSRHGSVLPPSTINHAKSCTFAARKRAPEIFLFPKITFTRRIPFQTPKNSHCHISPTRGRAPQTRSLSRFASSRKQETASSNCAYISMKSCHSPALLFRIHSRRPQRPASSRPSGIPLLPASLPGCRFLHRPGRARVPSQPAGGARSICPPALGEHGKQPCRDYRGTRKASRPQADRGARKPQVERQDPAPRPRPNRRSAPWCIIPCVVPRLQKFFEKTIEIAY